MSDLGSTNSARTKYAAESVILAGTKAYDAAILYQALIEPRCPAKTIPELADDLQTVGAAVPAAKQARTETAVSIAAQRTLLTKGMKLIRGVRGTVRKNTTDLDVRKAYGIGVSVTETIAKDVLAVLNLIQDRATKKPAEPATLGITQKDLDAVKQAIADITEAFNSREKQRAAAPLTTKKRNQILNRILRGAGRISAAGQLEFVDDPEIAQRFADIMPAPVPKKKSAAKKATAAKPKTKAAVPPAAPAPAPAATANDAPANDAPAPTPEASTPPAAPASPPETPATPAAATPAAA